MTTTIKAVYSKGVFRPATPVAIADGTEVELTVSSDEPAVSPEKLVDGLRRIAGLPLEGLSNGFSGADHDCVLYPREKH